jgi:hypothetical protein
MKNYKLFEDALNTMFWSWGSDPAAEVIWAGNDFLTWIEIEYRIKMENTFEEDTDGYNFDLVLDELKLKLDK